jgi:hypothetical protein
MLKGALKEGKGPGFDGMHSEVLIRSGKNTKRWLARFFTDILLTGKIPYILKLSKIIAILKPVKMTDSVESYRQIALLSASYKLLERLLYNRISPIIQTQIQVKQAGFRPDRSCIDQVLALTTYIETGFQWRLYTATAFVDLTTAYDTVWREGLIYKLLQTVPCEMKTRLKNNMLKNRAFCVVMGQSISNIEKLSNGLPQGSVLSPLLFNLYTSDLPKISSRMFAYAHDITIPSQMAHLERGEDAISNDLSILGDYFKRWRPRPNVRKTEVTAFHSNNKLANRELRIEMNGSLLRNNIFSKYLGVTLDRTLAFRQHLKNVAAKLKTRYNVIQKLCGTMWGSSADTLRGSVMGLVYSVAEHCASVWLNSAHTGIIDSQLNSLMRLISVTIRSTPVQWLPVEWNLS